MIIHVLPFFSPTFLLFIVKQWNLWQDKSFCFPKKLVLDSINVENNQHNNEMQGKEI